MAPESENEGAVSRAFGAVNRARLLSGYLDGCIPLSVDTAWLRVYELLLWIDRTTGLAHCYESDKCQPGRPWYARSLAFHDWLSASFGVEPGDLPGRIDWLFRTATADLSRVARGERQAAAAEQRKPYLGQGFPLPGEDPELIDIISEVIGHHFASPPPDDAWQALTERVHAHLGQENKRKNLLGEGFEDTLAAIIQRLPGANAFKIANRVLLGDVPGFNPQGESEKRKRVDIAIWGEDKRRILVTAKWSVRADREEQFGTDFDAYVRMNAGRPFDYVLVTNEFDAARLKAACDRLASNAPLFSAVVHVNPEGVLAAYGGSQRGAAAHLRDLIGSGRLVSLGAWLSSILS